MAFLDELADYGDRVRLWPQDERGLLDLDAVLATEAGGTLVYCCGPAGLIDAMRDRCRWWPPGSLRVERFAARTYRVMSVPTLTIFKGGQPVRSVTGARLKGDLVKLIESAL